MESTKKIEAFKEKGVYGTGKALKTGLVVCQKFKEDQTGSFTIAAEDSDGDPVLMPIPKKLLRLHEKQGWKVFTEKKASTPKTPASK